MDLKHPNILEFLGIAKVDAKCNTFGIVSPWIENGNVTEYLTRNPQTTRLPLVCITCSSGSLSLTRSKIRGVADGVKFLHEKNVVHCDIKGVSVS